MKESKSILTLSEFLDSPQNKNGGYRLKFYSYLRPSSGYFESQDKERVYYRSRHDSQIIKSFAKETIYKIEYGNKLYGKVLWKRLQNKEQVE